MSTLGPVLRVGQARVLAGTCSWTDATLVKETDWYPKRTMTAAERLAFYASRSAAVMVFLGYQSVSLTRVASVHEHVPTRTRLPARSRLVKPGR